MLQPAYIQYGGHEDLGADLVHDEAVDEARQAVHDLAEADDDTETRVGDAVFGRQARHRDGEVFPDEVEDGVADHRDDDDAPLPEFEPFLCIHGNVFSRSGRRCR